MRGAFGRACYDAGFGLMLRAALIGFGSTGKTTLFQLMTSARETGRGAHGKGEASIGISKVPDGRLDRLTAMYNPKKRVPATVEFSDLRRGGPGGAQALVDVAAYKNADALRARAARVPGSGACRTPPGRSIRRATRRRWKTS